MACGSDTYIVAADGALTLMFNGLMLNGAVSADGHVLVLADINPKVLGANPAIIVGLGQ